MNEIAEVRRCDLALSATREDLLGLQAAMQAELDNPNSELLKPVDCPVEHFFAPYMYGRRIFMPAGSLVVGKIHKHSHLNNISQGKVRVVTEFGAEELAAPYEFVSEAGTKRAVYVLEDCIWTTYHHNPTDTRDLIEIEKEVIAENYSELDLLLGGA